MDDWEHAERLTIIPIEWLPWLIGAGLLVMVWMAATGAWGLITGKPTRRAPAISSCVVAGLAIWYVTIDQGKDLADGAATALIGMLGVLVVWCLYHLLRGRSA